jgi:hypothetical protein
MACPHAPRPDDGNADPAEAAVLEAARALVWQGEYDPEEVLLVIEDDFDSDGYDEGRVRAAIRREFAAKRRAERTWPKVTDCDRLDDTFDALEGHGIVAEHLAGFTQSDGFEVVSEIHRESGGEKPKFVGYCFYTTQDQERALTGGMYIAFGHFSGGDNKVVEIGRLVRSELERAGLTVTWDGTSGRRLYLRDFRWQRRG